MRNYFLFPDIFSDFTFPLYWDSMLTDEAVKVSLQPSSREYKTVKEDFKQSSNKTIVKVSVSDRKYHFINTYSDFVCSTYYIKYYLFQHVQRKRIGWRILTLLVVASVDDTLYWGKWGFLCSSLDFKTKNVFFFRKKENELIGKVWTSLWNLRYFELLVTFYIVSDFMTYQNYCLFMNIFLKCQLITILKLFLSRYYEKITNYIP